MKDRLTKKRVKVDYERLIIVLGLTYDFTAYLFNKKSNCSIRRQALAFLKTKRVNIPFSHFLITDLNLRTHGDLLKNIKSVEDLKELYL